MGFILTLLLSTTAFAMGSKIPKPQPSDKQYVVKGLTASKQEETLWCAASAGQMLLSQFGKAPEQCEIASRFHGTECCARSSIKCIQAMNVEGIARLYGKSARSDSSPTFNEAFNLIRQGIPVSIYHYQDAGSTGTSGHTVVAYWAYISGGKKYIVVYDPWTGTKKFWDESYTTGNLAWFRLVWMR